MDDLQALMRQQAEALRSKPLTSKEESERGAAQKQRDEMYRARGQQLLEAEQARQAASQGKKAQERQQREAIASEQARLQEQVRRELQRQNQEQQERLQAAVPRLQARISQAYQGWASTMNLLTSPSISRRPETCSPALILHQMRASVPMPCLLSC